MPTLSADITATQRYIPAASGVEPGFYTIGSESIRVSADRAFERNERGNGQLTDLGPIVTRGIGGSTPAAHLSGASLTAYSPAAPDTAGASGAPTDAQYLVAAAHADLSAEVVVTAAGLALLDDAAASNQRTTLGLGTAAVEAAGAFEAAGGIATHAADTTAVHGIADTAALLTPTTGIPQGGPLTEDLDAGGFGITNLADGGTFDYIQEAEPGAVDPRTSWVRTPPDIEPEPWAALETYPEQMRITPTVPNGHWYTSAAGTSGALEPTFPTDGSSVVDGTCEWQDEGLLDPVAVGQRQLWYFDEDAEEFVRIGIADTVGQDIRLRRWSADGTEVASFGIDSSGAGVIASGTFNGAPVASVKALTTGYVEIKTGGVATPPEVEAAQFQIKAGTADPSAGGGVGADIRSFYMRDNAGTGELWFKTGAADTAWEQVTTS